MKPFKITLLVISFTTCAYSQSYINYVIGKYSGICYRDACPSAVTTPGFLYLYPSTNHAFTVWEQDSCSVWNLGEPWEIQVNADSSLIRYPGITQTDSAAALGRLFKNDSLHLQVTTFGAPNCHRIFDGHKLYSTAGIEEYHKQSTELIVSPNPTNDVMYVQNVNTGIKEKPILYDINGKEHSIEANYINSTAYKMDVRKLPNGIYYIRCKTGMGFESKKVIIQH